MTRPARLIRAWAAMLLCAAVLAGSSGCKEKARSRGALGSSEAFDVLAGRPTADSVTLNVVSPADSRWVVEWGEDPARLTQRSEPKRTGAGEPVEVVLRGLAPSRRYYYRVVTSPDSSGVEATEGRFHTQRAAGESFVFTMTTDSHLVPGRARDRDSPFGRAMAQIQGEGPDFHITLGDEAMMHATGFLARDQNTADAAYRNFRRHYVPVARIAPVFYVLGNHEGEGWIDEAYGLSRALATWARTARTRFVPDPVAGTYPEGGSPDGNYFAWTWGDALFIALDPFSYSTTRPRKPEDWTLGRDRLPWLGRVLRESKQKWKFVFVHHLVGGSPFAHDYGAMGQYPNYGRGGAAFAHVGEQGLVHELMRHHGAQILFKGHDHIFADETADGIRYTTCGRMAERPDGPPWAANQEFRDLYPGGFSTAWGYIRVTVSPQSVTVAYVALDGEERGGYVLGR